MKILNKTLMALSVISLLSVGTIYGRGAGEHREGMQHGTHTEMRSSSQKDFDRSELNRHGTTPGAYNRGMEAGEAVGGAAAGDGVVEPQIVQPVQPIQYVPVQQPNM